MSGQNTRKQIIAMVLLMAIGLMAMLAYVWFDEGRRAESDDRQAAESAERGAHLFANNCRVCHGNAGVGRDGHPGLIGPSINNPNNTFAYRTDNTGAFSALQNSFAKTIGCGRNGTAMPPWAIDQGGSLNFFKIENLVDLITTNAGNAWEHALEKAKEQDETLLSTLKSDLRAAIKIGDQERIEEAEASLVIAESRYEQGLPIAVATPSVTANTCGQITISDSDLSAARSDVVEIDVSDFEADLVHGKDLFFGNGCNVCHGETGEGLIGPRIANTNLTISQVVDQYRSPRENMPAFTADIISDEDVFDIFSWLQTLGMD